MKNANMTNDLDKLIIIQGQALETLHGVKNRSKSLTLLTQIHSPALNQDSA